MFELEAACEQLNEVSLEKQAPAGGSVESRPDLGLDPNPTSGPVPVPGPDQLCVTIGATVPTGFEQTAADEVREKLGSQSRISKDRGKIYFDISVESLSKVHSLRSVDNLFVVVQEFRDYQFKETKEDVLKDFEDLAGKLPWSDPLKVWKINTSFKKKKTKRKKLTQQNTIFKEKMDDGQGDMGDEKQITNHTMEAVLETIENQDGTIGETPILAYNKKVSEKPSAIENKRVNEIPRDEAEPQVLKFRVTCNRAGENHSFTSNEAARDFGGAVQDYFKWKADMTNFDVEVLLNVHNNEIVVGIALTEESLHRRNITHFGPTTLRSTLAYGMLRLCSPQPTDIIVDPMCGTGAIPIEGAAEWPNCYHIAGDNNPLAVKRAANNILSLLTKSQIKERIGSKKKNWNLYPSCLQEMSRVCRPGTGRAVLLTQDRKCFSKALSRMGHVWRKVHTVWVNIGGLHAAVYLLKRTSQVFIHPSEIEHEKGTS
ncbi:tRNA (guanine(6)-N2)-methyltransferase THUMP3 isoform X2 [Antechinus flavipes]|uniref:tRNA (guanine(6)-N2)-methyltransferase THUMP3 isoform X2 n=1 Tax=Antechinus flavipes TaxID=38775 RepID=UPI00223661E4|nr:tRNA (guanine(6)-N2)-methyltransferase THUMP3 isoform X2 [Antechinus flavipes]